MRLFITSFFESIAIKITDWRHGIGTYLYTNISLHPDGNKVSCVITDNLGMNYMSKAISISVEGVSLYVFSCIICICYSTGRSDIRDIFHEL